jgi:hypothetical protein
MMPTRSFALSAALLLAALGGGCSKQEEAKREEPAQAAPAGQPAAQAPAEGAVAGLDACALIATAAVSDAVGVPVQDGVRNDSGAIPGGAYSATCLWRIPASPEQTAAATAPAGPAYAILNVIKWPDGSPGAAGYLEDFRKSSEAGIIDHKPVPLQIGEEALFWGDGVAVRKGPVSFGVSVRLPVKDAERQRSIEEVLARQIADRL